MKIKAKETKDQVLYIRVTKEVKNILESVSKKTKRSMSEIIETLIKELN